MRGRDGGRGDGGRGDGGRDGIDGGGDEGRQARRVRQRVERVDLDVIPKMLEDGERNEGPR